MAKEVIGLDFDGVVGDIEHALWLGMKEMCGRTFEKGCIQQYGLEEDLGLTAEEVDILIDKYACARNITLQTPLLPGVKEFLLELLEHQPLIIITARKDIESVYELMSNYLCIPNSEDIYVDHARSGTKGKLMRELGVTMFVDDYWKNLIDAARWGVRPIILDQTWNRTPLSGHKRLQEMTWRIKDLNELTPLLNGNK
jgi:uncharacterized HAD superfamily protein